MATPDPSNPPADPPADPNADPPADPPADDKTGADDLRELKAALAAERKARVAAEREATKLRDEHATDAEKAIAAARDEGRREALGQVTGRMIEAEVRAAAAGRLADPADAVRLLDLAALVDDETGEIDAKAIATAVDQLVENKPYLRAGTETGRANGSHPAPQGTRPGPAIEGDGDAFLRRVVRGT